VERVGLEMDITEATATTGGYLGVVQSRFFGYSVEIKIEISLRSSSSVKPETALIASDFVSAYTALQLPQDVLVGGKLKALRERAKSRDFYDLYFILRKGLLPPSERRVLPQVLTQLKHTRAGSFQELKSLLPKSHHRILRDFRTTLERELKRYL
jgi:predicted nucleotidyltransferase component of viral defense system